MTQMSYQGKKGCKDPRCRQDLRYFTDPENYEYPGHCYGNHCAECDQPSSMYGHMKSDDHGDFYFDCPECESSVLTDGGYVSCIGYRGHEGNHWSKIEFVWEEGQDAI